MGGFAWVTLATNDSYSLGALVLANSLKQAGTQHQLAVLVTPGVTNSMKGKLSGVFNVVQEVNILDSKDEANLRLLKRPELGVTFTKLHCWRLTQFDKCVFLDADTLVLQNCDELFDREELSAAPDVGWPDCFNSGVFVYRPAYETYEKLIQFALDRGSFDGGDQGLLNLYFSDWSSRDISKHLPFIYNLCSTACYSYLPAFKQFGGDAKIIHFIGTSKPWLQYFNTETQKVQPTSDLRHLEGVLQHWWNIFCALIHPNLTPDMARSSSDVTHTRLSSRTSPPNPVTTKTLVWDPWEEYHQKQIQEPTISRVTVSVPPLCTPHQENEPSQIKPVESHNTNADIIASREQIPPAIPTYFHETSKDKDVIHHHHSTSLPDIPNHVPEILPNSVRDSPEHDERLEKPPPDLYCFQDLPEQVKVPNEPEPKPSQPIPVPTNECEAAATVCTETALHTPPREEECDSGLAGAFAQLTLGAPRTAEQSALDDHLRRQGWEVGNIDYLGRDSFDNIWSKICATLAAGAPSAPASPTTEATPSPTEAPVEKTATEATASLSSQENQQETSQFVISSTPVTPQAPETEPSPITPPTTTITQEAIATAQLQEATLPTTPETTTSGEAIPAQVAEAVPSSGPPEAENAAQSIIEATPAPILEASAKEPEPATVPTQATISTPVAETTTPAPVTEATISAPKTGTATIPAPPSSAETVIVASKIEAVAPAQTTDATVPATTTQATVPATITQATVPATITQATVPETITPATVPATITQATVPPTITKAAVPASAEDVISEPKTQAVPATTTVASIPASLTETLISATTTEATVPATIAESSVSATITAAAPQAVAVPTELVTEAASPATATKIVEAAAPPIAKDATATVQTTAPPSAAEITTPLPVAEATIASPAAVAEEATTAASAPLPTEDVQSLAEKTKSKPGTEQKSGSGAAAASPTPPPRKGSGGAKKTKSKK